jgi:uncharacterized protein
MEFEYDPQKSKLNKKKHGIDFEEAQHLWEDMNRLQVQANSETEPRFALMAVYGDKLWTAFFTIRNDRTRIISVRRARKNEGRLYYES